MQVESEPSLVCRTITIVRLSVPTIFFDHMGKFNYVFALFVFLTGFKSMFVFPSQCRFAALAVDVSHSMQSSQEHTFFSWSTAHVHHGIEEISSSLASLERLGDEFVVVGQVSPAVDAAVLAVAVGQVRLERLHHLANR